MDDHYLYQAVEQNAMHPSSFLTSRVTSGNTRVQQLNKDANRGCLY